MAGFALDSTGGVVLQSPTESAAGPATSLTGGQVASSGGGAPVDRAPGGDFGAMAAAGMATFNALNKLTSGALQPMLDQQKKRQYFDGMAQVAQGQSMLQVKAEQPKFLQIFGPSATTQGAQAMTAMSAMNQSQTDFMSQMPDLRTKSPEEMKAYLVDQASKLGSTGDPATDAMVQAKLAEQFGPMLQTHMRAHMQYVQEQNLLAFTNSNISAGDAYQATLGANGANMTPDAKALAEQNVQDSFIQPPGMADDAWAKSTVQSATANLQRGNFGSYAALKASPEWNKIPIESRTQLEEQVPVFAAKHMLTDPNSANILTSQQGLVHNLSMGTSGLSTPDEVNAVIDQFNTNNRTQNGSPTDMIDNKTRAGMIVKWQEGEERRMRLASKAAEKQGNYNAYAAMVGDSFNTGNYAQLKNVDGPPKAASDMMDAAYKSAIGSGDTTQMQTYFNKAAAVASEEKLRSPILQQTFTQQLGPLVSGDGPATPDQQSALMQASLLYHSPQGGAGALASYLGPDAPKVAALLDSGIDVSDPKQLTAQRQIIARGGAAIASQADRTAAKAFIADQNPGTLWQMMPFTSKGSLTPFELTPGNQAALADLVAPKIAQYQRAYHLDAKTAAPLVLSDVMKNADMVPGAFILHNASVTGDNSFSGAVNRNAPGVGNQNTSVYQDTMQEMINERLTNTVAKAGGDMTNFDPSKYEVASGEQLGSGMMTLFMRPKDASKIAGGFTMIRLDAGRSKDDPDGFTARLLQNVAKHAASAAQADTSRNPFQPDF